jgi:hypothetical protein
VVSPAQRLHRHRSVLTVDQVLGTSEDNVQAIKVYKKVYVSLREVSAQRSDPNTQRLRRGGTGEEIELPGRKVVGLHYYGHPGGRVAVKVSCSILNIDVNRLRVRKGRTRTRRTCPSIGKPRGGLLSPATTPRLDIMLVIVQPNSHPSSRTIPLASFSLLSSHEPLYNNCYHKTNGRDSHCCRGCDGLRT